MSVTGRQTQLLYAVLSVACAFGQIPPGGIPMNGYAALHLRVVSDEAMKSSWRLIRSDFDEGIGALGILEVQNLSKLRIEEAKFYAEYYDRQGRLCFTLLFASGMHIRHRGEDTNPWAPGETRELFSVAPGFGSASEPVEAKVHLLGQRADRQGETTTSVGQAVQSPVTVTGGVAEQRLKLDVGGLGPGPVVDLLLAKVEVSPDGESNAIEILNSVNSDIQKWSERFVRQSGRFRPATSGLDSTEGTALLLFRVVIGESPAEPSSLVPRESPWIQAYARESRGGYLPPITQLIFARAAELIPFGADAEERLKLRTSDLNILEYTSPGSDWSVNLVGWTRDKSSGRQVMKWIGEKER